MVLSDTRQEDTGWRKWAMGCWACLECLVFGGMMYGWGSLVYVFKDEGIYADLCSSDDKLSNSTDDFNATTVGYAGGSERLDDSATSTHCAAQDSKMALCFTISTGVICFGCVCMGQVSYRYGTRVTRLVAFACFVPGSLCLAFVSKEMPWLMFPGLPLLGAGCLTILVTNIQVSTLFVVGSSTVVSLLAGCFDSSSAVLLMCKIAYDNGISRQRFFIVLAGLHVLTLISTFFFLPKDFITKYKPETVHSIEVSSVQMDSDKKVQPKTKSDKAEPSSLKKCLSNPMFLLHIIWLCLLQLRLNYFVGTLNVFLNRRLNYDHERVSYFTNVCFYIMMGGLISSFLAGLISDSVKRCCKGGLSKKFRDILPLSVPMALTTVLSVLLSTLVLIPSENVLYFIFVVLTMYRSFLFSMAAAFLSAITPVRFYGLLYGIMIVSGGVFGLTQYAFYTWSETSNEDGEFHANICLLVLVSLSSVHPLYMWLTCRNHEKGCKNNFDLPTS